MSIFFYQFKRWLKGLFFKNQKKEPDPPIQFEGLIKKLDEAHKEAEIRLSTASTIPSMTGNILLTGVEEPKEFLNSSAVEGLMGDVVVPLTDLQTEVREMSYFARANNIQEDIWDEPKVYQAGEIIDEESGLRAVATALDFEVFGDDIEMVSNRIPKAAYAVTTVNFTDYNKPKEEIKDFDPKVFEFKQPHEITKDQLITYLKGHAVPFEAREEFKRYGKMLAVTGGWNKWEWFPEMFLKATQDTLYEVYLQLRTVEHKQQTDLFMQLKLEENADHHTYDQGDSPVQTGDTIHDTRSTEREVPVNDGK